MTLDSNMWFVTINSVDEATDFSNWLRGKLKRFNDSMGFTEWLSSYKAFPLEMYFDGVHYIFKDRKEASLFLYGFEAALRAKFKY